MHRFGVAVAVAVALAAGVAACGSASTTAADAWQDAARDGAEATSDGGAPEATEDVSAADGTDAADQGQACFPLFHACTTTDECCAPNRCLIITGAPACQREGPQSDGGA